jgi:DivIVA domain-containing protein
VPFDILEAESELVAGFRVEYSGMKFALIQLGEYAHMIATSFLGALLFLGGSFLLGRGETQPPADLERSPVELPEERPVTGEDVRGLQVSVAVRGYRMTEVDWLLDQFATALDERDAELAALRGEVGELRGALDALRAELGA